MDDEARGDDVSTALGELERGGSGGRRGDIEEDCEFALAERSAAFVDSGGSCGDIERDLCCCCCCCCSSSSVVEIDDDERALTSVAVASAAAAAITADLTDGEECEPSSDGCCG